MTRAPRWIATRLALALALSLAAMLTMVLTGSMPALAQNASDQYSEPATVTFGLTIDGQVPEGKLLGVSTGVADAPAPVFCSTASFDTSLPRCEDGGTYTDTFSVLPASSTLSYEYYVMDYDYGGVVETFAADTITVVDGLAVNATYQVGDPEGKAVELTGTIEKPEATTYMYGTHGISDQYQGYFALQSDTVNLDAYVGQSVTVYGNLVSGYENGQVEGGPPLVNVTRVEKTPGEDRVTLSFELTVEGRPPADATFFGFIPAEGGISTRLTDPDGDGVYTSSMGVPKYPPGPVPPNAEPMALPVQIVQGTGTAGDGNHPNLPITVVRNFGQIPMDSDKTFSASVSFNGTDDTGSPGGISVLPDTGGLAVPLFLAGVLLVTGGALFARRFVRRR